VKGPGHELTRQQAVRRAALRTKPTQAALRSRQDFRQLVQELETERESPRP
jgi:hypothetical protein